MLVLSRKYDEVIHIGPDITITVVDIKDNKVRLGINAPADVKILRAELLTGAKGELTGDTTTDAEYF